MKEWGARKDRVSLSNDNIISLAVMLKCSCENWQIRLRAYASAPEEDRAQMATELTRAENLLNSFIDGSKGAMRVTLERLRR